MATLFVSKSTDFRGQVLVDVDKIVFTNPSGNAIATFDGSQFDGVQIRHDVTIIGNSQGNRLFFSHCDLIDASQWQFSSWSTQDTFTYSGSKENSKIFGSQLRDAISGNGGNDTLDGGAQRDSLIGGAGNDLLNGGTGFDTVNGGAGIDVIESRDGEGPDKLDGGQDTDSLILNRVTAVVDMLVDLNAGGVLAIGDGTSIVNFESMQLTTGFGDDFGNGGIFADLMSGNAGDDTFNGGDGNDQLDGGIGRNVLDGGTGDDFLFSGNGATGKMVGGDGIDFAVVDFSSVAAKVVFNIVGGGGGLSLSGVETLNATMGACNDKVTGCTRNYRLSGLGGNDQLIGRGGIDSLDGNDGNDVLIGGGGADFMFGGAGIDTLRYSASAAINVNLGAGVLSGGDAGGDVVSGIERVIGSGFADAITGDLNANLLNGGGGRDSLDGGAGDDRLIGGAGRDSLTGGLGADIFAYDTVFDSGVFVSARDVIADFDAGTATTFVDRIDLFTIDANALAVGNQKFAFIGGDAFTVNKPGQVRVGSTATNTFVTLNTDNDTDAEFRLDFAHLVAMRSQDFIL
ncbi:hypothetical protein BH10PSE7_BH10PSE7_32750 [soil metagenome]